MFYNSGDSVALYGAEHGETWQTLYQKCTMLLVCATRGGEVPSFAYNTMRRREQPGRKRGGIVFPRVKIAFVWSSVRYCVDELNVSSLLCW